MPQAFTQICRVFGGFLCAHLKWSSGDHLCLSKSQVIKPSVTRSPCRWILSHGKQKIVCTHFPVLKLDSEKSQESQSSLRWDCKLCSPVDSPSIHGCALRSYSAPWTCLLHNANDAFVMSDISEHRWLFQQSCSPCAELTGGKVTWDLPLSAAGAVAG